MEYFDLKHDCLKLLQLNCNSFIHITGYIEKTINLNEYIATAYMLKNTNETLSPEEIEKLFLFDSPVFFLKKERHSLIFVTDNENTRLKGKIQKVLSFKLNNNIYVAEVMLSLSHNKNNQDLISKLFCVGDNNLNNFTNFYFLI